MTLERIRAGDAEALGELMRDARAPLLRHLGSIAGSADAAEDAAQEAFVRLWERREHWQDGSARALVFRIGRNLALDAARRGQVRARRSRHPPVGPPGPATPEEELARAEVRARVEAALAGLAQRRREVFELVRFGGLTYQEVAEALELSPQTVANHMSFALRDLRSELAEMMGGGTRVDEDREEGSSRDG